MATLFPFLYWGIGGQILPALVNAVFWGVGIFLFRAALKSILQRLDASKDPKTLHGLLGETYSSSLAQKTAAGVTILGMLGVALGESYWGMQIVKVLVPEDTPAYYALLLGALFFVLAYIWYGGAWGSMKTDMLQLVFSYLGFTVVFLYAMWSIMKTSSTPLPGIAIVSLLMFVGGVWAVVIRLRKGLQPISAMDQDTEGRTWLWVRRLLSYTTLISMGILAIFFALLFFQSSHALTLAQLANPGDPKWKGVIALAIMPTIFQFVDMTAWQRMQAIDGEPEEVRNRARRGLFLFGIESPYSWILCLALGTLLAATMPQLAKVDDKAGPLAAYPRILLESGGALQSVVALAFMVAVMGVMLSLVNRDGANDLALLKVEGQFRAVPIGTSGIIHIGDPVFTIGFPNPGLQGLNPKFTDGKINSLSGAHDDARLSQMSIAVQPSNSGGPVVNSAGNVVGIVTARLPPSPLEQQACIPNKPTLGGEESVLSPQSGS